MSTAKAELKAQTGAGSVDVLGSVIFIFVLLPRAAQLDAVLLVPCLSLNVPSFVGSSEYVSADYADGSASNNILGIMFPRLHTAIRDKGRRRVSRDTILPTITLTQKLSGGK